MPSTSKSQQRLMGVAYAVKKGDMQISDVDVDYRDKVKDLVDGMTLKQLKGFAETKHEGLPEVVENISIDNVGGIGPVKLPTSTENGSGDVPAGQGDADEEYKKKRKKMKHLQNFESFVNESVNEARGLINLKAAMDALNKSKYVDESQLGIFTTTIDSKVHNGNDAWGIFLRDYARNKGVSDKELGKMSLSDMNLKYGDKAKKEFNLKGSKFIDFVRQLVKQGQIELVKEDVIDEGNLAEKVNEGRYSINLKAAMDALNKSKYVDGVKIRRGNKFTNIKSIDVNTRLIGDLVVTKDGEVFWPYKSRTWGWDSPSIEHLIKTIEELSAEEELNPSNDYKLTEVSEAMSFQDLVNKYKDNPYGIGASSIEYVESENWGNQLILRFEDNYSRKETEAELKKMGIKAKKMSKSTADKAFKYRYELTVFESKVNEEYVELGIFMNPTKELTQAFSKWYRETSMYWDDYSEDMIEDSADEAAKNAQMEILAYLSNKMNDVIGDRKFKVRADFR